MLCFTDAGVAAVAPLSCYAVGAKITCNGFLPSTPPGALITSSAAYGVTLTAAILEGGFIYGRPQATVVTTSM